MQLQQQLLSVCFEPRPLESTVPALRDEAQLIPPRAAVGRHYTLDGPNAALDGATLVRAEEWSLTHV